MFNMNKKRMRIIASVIVLLLVLAMVVPTVLAAIK